MDILNNLNLVNYVKFIKSLPYDEKIVHLTTNHPEWETNKILFDYYNTASDVILADGDLLRLIEAHRIGPIPRRGLDTFDPCELGFLMKAWKSQLYHRFMCHVLSRYIKLGSPHPVTETPEKLECCVCWRELHGIPEFQSHIDDVEDVAITVDGTKTVICKNCLMNLMRFCQFMSLLDDPDFNRLMLK